MMLIRNLYVIRKPIQIGNQWLLTNVVLHSLHVSESMEAFAKKKGKVGTRGGGQIIKENDESLVFYRFVLFSKIALFRNTHHMGKLSIVDLLGT